MPEKLVLAILAALRDKGITPSKTKLLKLLYLIDLDQARSIGKTATSWDWKFLHFGPWSHAYDPTLEQLEREGFIRLQKVGLDERTTLVATERPDLDVSKIDDIGLQMSVGRIISRWGAAELPAILNFVYFDTEPMKDAERDETLDFRKVPRGRTPVYKRTTSDNPQLLREFRARVRAARPTFPSGVVANGPYTPPVYDEVVVRAIAALEDED